MVLNGHMDTVPIDNESLWTTDPFGARGPGRLPLRPRRLRHEGRARRPDRRRALPERDRPRSSCSGSLVLHFAAGEERGEPGTRSLLEAGFARRLRDHDGADQPEGGDGDPRRWRPMRCGSRAARSTRAGPRRASTRVWALGAGPGRCSRSTTPRSGPRHRCSGRLLHADAVAAGSRRTRSPTTARSRRQAAAARRDGRGRAGGPARAHAGALEGLNPELEYELGTDYVVEPAEIPPDEPVRRQRMLAAVRRGDGRAERGLGRAVLERRAQPGERRGDDRRSRSGPATPPSATARTSACRSPSSSRRQ